MPYKQHDYHVPSTKAELVQFIRRYYWVIGQTCHGIEKKSKGQLYAIYHSIRQRKVMQ